MDNSINKKDPLTKQLIDIGLLKEIETSKDEVIEKFIVNIISNQQDIPPEFAEIVNKKFWDMI